MKNYNENFWIVWWLCDSFEIYKIMISPVYKTVEKKLDLLTGKIDDKIVDNITHRMISINTDTDQRVSDQSNDKNDHMQHNEKHFVVGRINVLFNQIQVVFIADTAQICLDQWW